MTGRLLDVSTMPFERVYTCEDGSEINLREFLDSHYDAIQALAAAGLIKNNESFGFAMPRPMTQKEFLTLPDNFWDMPEEFVWFVGGWGPERDRYIANAIRKLRALLRYFSQRSLLDVEPMSTLDLRFIKPHIFQDKVDSVNEDGDFPWGDFPWGGAVLQQMGNLKLMGTVSCLTEIEDDFITKLILGGLGQKIVIGNKLLSD